MQLCCIYLCWGQKCRSMLNQTLILLLFACLPIQAIPHAVTDGWNHFATVKFSPKLFKEVDEYYLVPQFTPSIRQYENKSFQLKGHYMPIDMPDKRSIILSKFPYSACFFCGAAGSESVAEIRFKTIPHRFKSDQVITVRGTLVLNSNDFTHMTFILTDAELITH
jgi:hypothetical protein